jgi:hypothetical protein
MRAFTLVGAGIATAVAMIGSSDSARAQFPWMLLITCAEQNQTCYVPFGGTTVMYGKNGAVVTKYVTSSIPCNEGIDGFNADPLIGQVKSCTFVFVNADTDWKWCALEGQTCEISGSQLVRFGDTQNDLWVYRTFGAPLSCTRSVFGGDPDVGTVKECQIAVQLNVSNPAKR